LGGFVRSGQLYKPPDSPDLPNPALEHPLFFLHTASVRIALVADWLPIYAGAEHVIAEFHELWPDAPIFTTVANIGALGPLDHADIRVTKLQRWYRLLGKRHRLLLPWMPRALEGIDLSAYDIILSSSHAVGKGIIPPSTAVHVCYCHTPMRYAWEMENEYLRRSRFPRILHRRLKRALTSLRRWDLTTEKRVDCFLANSTETQNRIRSVYGRESTVIYPPVQDRFFQFPLSSDARGNAAPYLAIGRLVPYKRFDLLIACANTHNVSLRIAGTGPEEARLKQMAGPTVEFLGYVPEEDLPALYSESRALFLPQHEDAGIVPLEAQACGTPVIAYARGGALDTVEAEKTGIFFHEQTVEALYEAMRVFTQHTFDPRVIRAHAQRFSSSRFRRQVADVVAEIYKHHGSCYPQLVGK